LCINIIKEMTEFELIGTVEGTLVTIIEQVMILQKRGVLIGDILEAVENQRQSIGKDSDKFFEIMGLTQGNSSQASEAVPTYCLYRVDIEYPGQMSEDQFISAFMEAVNTLQTK
jgi:hypothetical protein